MRLSGSVTSKGWLLYGVPIHQAWKQYTGQPVALPHRTALSLYKLPFEHVSHEMCQNMMSMSLIVEFFLVDLPRLAKQQDHPAEGYVLCEIQHCGGEAVYIVQLRERGWN